MLRVSPIMHELTHGNGHTARRPIKTDCILYAIIPGPALVKLSINKWAYIAGTIRLDITI